MTVPKIKFVRSKIPLNNGKLLLDPQTRKRLYVIQEEDNADYVITQ